MSNPKQLPLWRNIVDTHPPDYGKFYSIETLEKAMGVKSSTVEFELEIMALSVYLRDNLEHSYILSRNGLKGTGWKILEREETIGYHLRMAKKSLRCQMNIIRTATATPTEGLDDEVKRKIESAGEKAAIRLVLMRRTGTIVKRLGTTTKELLNE